MFNYHCFDKCKKCLIPLTCRGSTTRATQIITTTSSWDGQICGVTSPKPTVEKVTMQKYKALKRDRLFLPARSKCWIPHVLKETERLQCSWWETEKKKEQLSIKRWGGQYTCWSNKIDKNIAYIVVVQDACKELAGLC